MTFETFCNIVNEIARKTGGIFLTCANDKETGKYICTCADGVYISGNSTSTKLTVRWGSDHQACISVA